ncbi:hypothetical protein BZA05DRAFT_394758 [Tricharina praecox]|uniref:uncharacterized protein n=1 Tax=Tricharina praecox TaxID=43433 RepID=UPI00221F8121|nr:uncharacterized protein BZA05DRAFT_394756 [Tricharina praecox]XP_051340333.1 uncharacterized protein BZA05DRAFT_394758 [Tricharina praecox]KAI5853787.1 hypothetical protein BZA05DRAFT_394756 [Tricharina praecox]KAI5853789.1 hypothetical protein BZA05DRAFT_394758 [Tricharina praecox]
MQFTTLLSLVASFSLATAAAIASPNIEARSPSGSCPSTYEHSGTAFLSDTSDCNVFYICDHNGPVKFNCPVGLHFSPSTWVCDYPASAGCSSYN